jgi:hypothetical protein
MDIESRHSPLQRARAKLKAPVYPDGALAAVAAAAFFAICALTFAAAAILAPPLVLVPMSVR